MANDILQQFSKYTIREIIEVLDEVFGRRMKPDEKKESLLAGLQYLIVDQ